METPTEEAPPSDISLDHSTLISDPDEAQPVPHRDPSISGRGLLILLCAIWCVELGLGIGFVFVDFLKTGDTSNFEMTMPAVLIITACTWMFTLLMCTGFGCWKYGVGIAKGFSIRRVEARVVWNSALIGGALSMCAIVISAVGVQSTDSPIQELIENDAASNSMGLPLFFMLFAMVVAPLEELYYRGFIFRALRNLIGTGLSAAIVIVWFGMLHAFQVAGIPLMIAVIMGMGAVCTYLRIRHDSVVPSMVCHFCYNSMLMVFTLIAFWVQGSIDTV